MNRITCLTYGFALLTLVADTACSKQGDSVSRAVASDGHGEPIQESRELPEHCKSGYVFSGDKDWADQVLINSAASLSGAEKAKVIARVYDAGVLSKIWNGCPIDMVTSTWGAPDRTMALPGGSAVLVWEVKMFPKRLGGLPFGCQTSITADLRGSIVGVVSKNIQGDSLLPIACTIDRRTGPFIADGN